MGVIVIGVEAREGALATSAGARTFNVSVAAGAVVVAVAATVAGSMWRGGKNRRGVG